jgi:membrane-bound ClpP family serine protease
MPTVVWPSLLLLVGVAMVMLEIFIPSGGAIGFLSFTSIVTAIVLAFVQSGPTTGIVFLMIACVAVPIALVAAFRFLPDTPMGKRLLPTIPSAAEVLPDSDERRKLREMVGHIGHAKSKMLPSGAVEVDGHIIDAMSEGGPIEPGQMVRVIEVRGAMVIVRPIDKADEHKHAAAMSDDVLSRPIESLGLDPFEDPLA